MFKIQKHAKIDAVMDNKEYSIKEMASRIVAVVGLIVGSILTIAIVIVIVAVIHKTN